MEWNIQAIRRESWSTTFRKGWRAWFMLVVVCFIFAFIGASNASQATFVDSADQLIGAQDDLLPGNIDYLKAYIVETPLVKNVPFITSELALAVIDSLSKSVTWVVRLLAVNLAYFERNPGEVIANMVLAALITTIGHFFIQNVIALGLDRYAMENRFQRQVPLRRTLALFHKANIWNLMRVMVLYRLTLILWSFTIVGGVYKFYQYSMVPYILAENPAASWREAKKLSARMTEGYKWKSFLAYLSYFYIWPLKAVPVAGLLIAVVWALALVILLLTYVMLVRERRREFAVLRLLGASRKSLCHLMLGEAALCSLLGGLAGVALASLFVFPFARLIESRLGLPYLSPDAAGIAKLAVLSVAATVLAGMFGGSWAAWQLSRTDVGTTLREGT